jgi:hypothetical protein
MISCRCSDFFGAHRKLPLKHMSIDPSNWIFDICTRNWDSAPTTLTQLILTDTSWFKPDVLPSSITHLQLLDLVFEDMEFVATALPGLRHLDIDLLMCQYTHAEWNAAFRQLSKLANLQVLRMCVAYESIVMASHCLLKRSYQYCLK